MPKFAEKKKYLFGITGSLKRNSTKLLYLSENKSNKIEKNFIQNLIKTSNERNFSEINCEKSEFVSKQMDLQKCCIKNQISEFTLNESNLLFDICQKLSYDHNREND
jgi:hypothetical protein